MKVWVDHMRYQNLVIIILLATLSNVSPSYALNSGLVYEWCKPYADRSFQTEKVEQGENDIKCVLAVTTLKEAAQSTCQWLKRAAEQGAAIPNQTFLGLIAANETVETNAAIQSFVNWARDNPDWWNNSFTEAHALWLGLKWECVIQN